MKTGSIPAVASHSSGRRPMGRNPDQRRELPITMTVEMAFRTTLARDDGRSVIAPALTSMDRNRSMMPLRMSWLTLTRGLRADARPTQSRMTPGTTCVT